MNPTQNHEIRIDRQGPPMVLNYATAPLPQPQQNEVLIKQEAIALNFVDILFRNGSFPLNHLPATIGVEAAGIVEAVGPGVNNFSKGDRVAYYFALGAYAEYRLISTDYLIRLPDDISFNQAASLLAKGLTARMLVKQAYPITAGDVVLVHAAAGGVGSLVVRWAKALGATVIGTVGNAAKKALVSGHGADYVIALDIENLETQVKQYTRNQGVSAVFDGVGKATFASSVPLLQTGGTIVLYGTASGAPVIDSALLASRKIHLVRPALNAYLPDKTSISIATDELFKTLRSGVFGETTPTIYNLSDAAKAHQDLESGLTTGSVIFHPNK